MNRKGQVEAFGLVIIVVLLVFIGLFVLIFNKGIDNSKSNYLSSKAYNLANALQKADVVNSEFKDLANECCLNSCNSNSCSTLESFVGLNLRLLDEESGFVLQCGSCSLKVGNCFLGINSEKFRDSDYELYTVMCPK